MSKEPIVVTREALYEQVWSEPISKIASRFGLSDRGLAKLCGRYDIPVPARGWWAKKHHGHKVRQEPLPSNGRVKPITIHRYWARPIAPNITECAEIVFEHQPENRIIVRERLTTLHPFVTKTKAALKRGKPLHYDRPLLFPAGGCLSVNVSRAEVPRALRIMDALVRACEQRGYAPSLPPDRAGLLVNVLGEPFSISLVEKTKQVIRESTDAGRRSQPAGTRSEASYDFVPNGLLCLRARDAYWPRFEVTDTETHALEDRLNRFIVRLIEEALKDRHARAEREKRERLRQEEAARAAAEQQKIDRWDQWMMAWKKAQDVRAFAAAIRERLAPIQEGSEISEWLAWTEAYADRIDPIAANGERWRRTAAAL